MKVLVIGANGKVGQKVVKKLVKENHDVVAMIRKEEQKERMQSMGASPVVADLEGDISHAYADKPDAVIFSAGSGAGTGSDKTTEIDLKGARKSIDEAIKHHVPRYIMVSALGANDAKNMAPDMQHYFVAKSEADQHLVQSELDYTIFRPGQLKDNEGNGNVDAAESLESYGDRSTSRTNLATAIAKSIDKRNTYKKVIEIVDGKTPINDAIAAI